MTAALPRLIARAPCAPEPRAAPDAPPGTRRALRPRQPELFRRWPALAAALPFVPLLDAAPTPVERLAGMSQEFGLEDLYVKRDDLSSAAYGGNKVRKLEWLLGDAERQGARAVITLGASGSHHAYATAVFARARGLEATLILAPQPDGAHARAMLAATEGARARVVRARCLAAVPGAWARGYVAARRERGAPFCIAAGGSSALGALGYVDAGLELAAQIERGEAPVPDYVYAAAGTCGTVAGLSVGLQLGAARVPALARTVVVGVRVVPSLIAHRRRIERLRRAAAALLAPHLSDLPERCARGPLVLLGEHLGAGYGHPTAAGARAADAARADGLVLDPTYTAKAMAGMRAHASAPERRRAVHLYLHTLGRAPAA